jgi:hypothetical protein
MPQNVKLLLLIISVVVYMKKKNETVVDPRRTISSPLEPFMAQHFTNDT